MSVGILDREGRRDFDFDDAYNTTVDSDRGRGRVFESLKTISVLRTMFRNKKLDFCSSRNIGRSRCRGTATIFWRFRLSLKGNRRQNRKKRARADCSYIRCCLLKLETFRCVFRPRTMRRPDDDINRIRRKYVIDSFLHFTRTYKETVRPWLHVTVGGSATVFGQRTIYSYILLRRTVLIRSKRVVCPFPCVFNHVLFGKLFYFHTFRVGPFSRLVWHVYHVRIVHVIQILYRFFTNRGRDPYRFRRVYHNDRNGSLIPHPPSDAFKRLDVNT